MQISRTKESTQEDSKYTTEGIYKFTARKQFSNRMNGPLIKPLKSILEFKKLKRSSYMLLFYDINKQNFS